MTNGIGSGHEVRWVKGVSAACPRALAVPESVPESAGMPGLLFPVAGSEVVFLELRSSYSTGNPLFTCIASTFTADVLQSFGRLRI
ncbi:hypothetical protein [Eilatimonas milleporae]|uniref:hypothetical protein n=1 Tax=Eilatimonas milleporae TaxID=911205 RepID=UPI0011C37F35|nr:hypothetical protein [Eilatimonas milleporae]